MTHEEARERLEAYALGALDEGERREVAAHFAACAECRQLVDEYAIAVESLPGALAAASRERPSSASRARVLHAAATSRRAWRIAGALVAALLLLSAVGWAFQLNQTLAQERALYQRLAGQQEMVFEIVDSPRVVKLVLRPPVSGSTAYGKVFTRPDLPFAVAMAANLADPPSGSAYQLWATLDSGETVLLGVLQLRDGFGSLGYEFDRNGPSFQSARLTLQPKGATAPEGVPVLLWLR